MPDLPFPEAEYRARATRVRAEMARRDIDVLFVMSPPNLTYLTGFESIWYPPRAPVGVAISRHDDDLVFLDYERHENHARNLALFDDAVFYRYDNAVVHHSMPTGSVPPAPASSRAPGRSIACVR